MNFHLHFLILATCLPTFAYCQVESREDDPKLPSDSRYVELSTIYLDPRRRIEPLNTYTDSSERIIPDERRSSSYFEDGYKLERPPYRPNLRRRRPFPRVSSLGRHYGRQLRRPSFLRKEDRLRPRFERSRPVYDPYFREFEPPRRVEHYRPRRRRLRIRSRVSHPRGSRRRTTQEYYRRDGEYRPIDYDSPETSSLPSFPERLLGYESFLGRTMRIFGRPRLIEPRENSKRRSRPFRDRSIETVITQADERPISPLRRLRLEPRTDLEQNSYEDVRLPNERLLDRISARQSESMTMFRPSQRREIDFRRADFIDIHNSFEEPSPLVTRMPPRGDIYNSTTVDSLASSYSQIIQPSLGEELYPPIQKSDMASAISDQSLSKEYGTSTQADGFLDKTDSIRNNGKNIDTFVSQRSNTKLSKSTKDINNKNTEQFVFSEPVELTASPEQVNGDNLSQKRDISSEHSLNSANTVKFIKTASLPFTTIKMVRSKISSDIQQNMPHRVVGSANVLSEKHPKFLRIPLPIPQSSIILNLKKEGERKTTLPPITLTTTQLKLVVDSQIIVSAESTSSSPERMNRDKLRVTEDTLSNRATTLMSASEGAFPVKENPTKGLRKSVTRTANRDDDSMIPEQNVLHADRLLTEETVPVRLPTEKTLRDDQSVSKSVLPPPDIPIQNDGHVPLSSRNSSRRDYIDKLPLTDRAVFTRERYLRDDPTPVYRKLLERNRYREELSLSESEGVTLDKPRRGERGILLSRRRPVKGLPIDKRRMSEGDTFSLERPYRNDLRSRNRRVFSDKIYRDKQPLTEDDVLSTERFGNKRPIARLRRQRSRFFRENPLSRTDERRVEANIPSRRRRLSVSDIAEIPVISSRRVTRQLLRLNGGHPPSPTERIKKLSKYEVPVRRRRLPASPEERHREAPGEKVSVRRRRPTPTKERVRETQKDEMSVRRGRPSHPNPRERVREMTKKEILLRRRRPPTHEERFREVSKDEVSVRDHRPSTPEERLREMTKGEVPVRLHRPLPLEEQIREMPKDEEQVRRRRLSHHEKHLREDPKDKMQVMRPRILSPGERLGRLPLAVDSFSPRRLSPHVERPGYLQPEYGPKRRRRLSPFEERLPREEEPVRRRRLRPLKEQSIGMSTKAEPSRRGHLLPVYERLRIRHRGRRPFNKERSHRRQYVPLRRRAFASERLIRPRVKETFSDGISQSRLRPRARLRTRRLETDVKSILEERGFSTDETTTLAPIQSVTERLRLGAVRARGGEDGYPVHGGYCPGEPCADGGLAAGVQNGTGTGTLALFLERKRTGTNEDIAAYERDLRPRITETTLT